MQVVRVVPVGARRSDLGIAVLVVLNEPKATEMSDVPMGRVVRDLPIATPGAAPALQ